MSIEAPHSPESTRNASNKWKIKFGGAVLAGTALWGLAVNELANQISRANDPHDGPRTEIAHIMNYPPGIAPTKAQVGENEPNYEELARNSKFVLVIQSGTGMETSQYTANVLYDTVQNLGGVILYSWYGTHYDSHASAISIRDAIRKITPEGEVKPVLMLGQSFGGIAVEDESEDPVLQSADFMNIKKIIMIETPMDLNDATETFFGMPISWFKDAKIPEFNGLTTLVNAINGQYLREELGVREEWTNTFINAARTSPQLMQSQVERIQQGMRKVNPYVSVDYIGSTDSKKTVNHLQAYERLEGMANAKTKIRYIQIAGVDHDEIWLSKQVDKYIPSIIDSIKDVVGKEA